MESVSKQSLLQSMAFLLVAVVMTALPAMLAAQEDVGEDDIVRFRRRLAADGGAELVLHQAPGASKWTLRLSDKKSGETLARSDFPEWAGADYYGYDVIVADDGPAKIVVFEAGPAPGLDAPPSAENWQVAYAYGDAPNESGKRWRIVAETTSTPLDGGDRLVFRKVDGDNRLVRLRVSDRTIFCGAELASFEVFDPEQLAFRTRLAVDQLVEGAGELKAALPEKAFEPSPYRNFYGWFSASSDRRNRDDARTAPRPIELGDEDMGSAWSEGAAGDGRGEFVTARINRALRMQGFRIVPGNARNQAEYDAWARPKKILVSLSEGRRFIVELPDISYRTLASKRGIIVPFPEPLRTNCMSIVILEARNSTSPAPGDDAWKSGFTAISELTPLSELHGLPRDVAALVTVEMLLKEQNPRRARRLSTLVSPLGDELIEQLRRVLATGREEDRVRVVPLLRGLPSSEAVAILTSLFEQIPEDDRSYPLVKRSLVPHGERAADALMDLDARGGLESDRKQTDLVRLVGRLGTNAHRQTLAKKLGEGNELLRNERARAVARGGLALLPFLFETIEAEPDSSRGYDALRVVTSLGRQRFYRGQGIANGSSSLLTALEESESRRSQLLVIRALRYFDTDGAVERLSKIAKEAPDPLARREAIESIGRYEGRSARRAVELGLSDRSPDVRIAAVSAISRRADRSQSIPEVRVYVDRETWKQGLADGYTLIANAGDKASIEFLERAIARDETGDRAVLIIGALERADQPVSDGVLLRILQDESSDFLLVKNTIDLLGLSNSEESLGVLAEMARGNPFSDRFDERKNSTLQTRALLALGRRRAKPAAEVLLSIIADAKDPGVVRTALRGISFMADRSLIRRLQLIEAAAPEGLRDDFQDAVDSIDRRASVQEVEEEIEELTEDVENRAQENESKAPPKE